MAQVMSEERSRGTTTLTTASVGWGRRVFTARDLGLTSGAGEDGARHAIPTVVRALAALLESC